MAWEIEVMEDCAVVRMNTNKVNVQNAQFFADLHGAFDRLEREFSELPVVLTGHADVFSAGIDFQYSFDIFGSGSAGRDRLLSGDLPGPATDAGQYYAAPSAQCCPLPTRQKTIMARAKPLHTGGHAPGLSKSGNVTIGAAGQTHEFPTYRADDLRVASTQARSAPRASHPARWQRG